MICGSGGSKSGSLKRRVRSQPTSEKLHAIVARSTFPSQKCQKLRVSGHIWKLRCRKSARRCGAKHISKSKCTKHFHVQRAFGSSEVEKAHAVVARSTFASQNVDVQMLEKCTLTNLTNLTALTNLTNLTYALDFTCSTTSTNLTYLLTCLLTY